MKDCLICNSEAMLCMKGKTDGVKVYAVDETNKLTTSLWEEYPGPPSDCDNGLIQFSVEGKWGFAHLRTGDVVIKPVWDFAMPFQKGKAMVIMGCVVSIPKGHDWLLRGLEVHGGKYGYIDSKGTLIKPCNKNF
ncbi:WG repeat-containing protein [Anaerovorax odorimutans]|uniref:WG repeat-containing protein n=1 Tax=Anaerovorax odorimutans TaxID=109327 RepID=UPI0003F965CE|nr:WG repeat-containing protein [Anaerovorax odorimutans]